MLRYHNGIRSIARTADVTATLDLLYGTYRWGRQPGVVHIAATLSFDHATTTPTTPLDKTHTRFSPLRHNLLINEHTPHNPYDSFALAAARAASDVIVTTGRILRNEPHCADSPLSNTPRLDALLAKWRASLGLGDPVLCVLTSGEDLPVDHKVFQQKVIVFCPEEAAAKVAVELPDAEVVGKEKLDVAAVVAGLRQMGFRRILIEAGPSTSSGLYSAGLVDLLLLTTMHPNKSTPKSTLNLYTGEPFHSQDTLCRTLPYTHGANLLCGKDVPTEDSWYFQAFSATNA